MPTLSVSGTKVKIFLIISIAGHIVGLWCKSEDVSSYLYCGLHHGQIRSRQYGRPYITWLMPCRCSCPYMTWLMPCRWTNMVLQFLWRRWSLKVKGKRKIIRMKNKKTVDGECGMRETMKMKLVLEIFGYHRLVLFGSNYFCLIWFVIEVFKLAWICGMCILYSRHFRLTKSLEGTLWLD